ncbi:UNVERIFIED_CONTAM: suppressor of tub2 mutation [Siphonaria sp. JEL0065]|nr:suppressor of tub2 mutation [Siphonaria sp. JEL0065]
MSNDIVSQFTSKFVGGESEENWAGRDKAMAALTEALVNDALNVREALAHSGALKLVLDPILKSSASLRTALAMTSCACVGAIAAFVDSDAVEVQLEPAVKAMLKLAGATKKLIATSASAAMVSLLKNTQFHLRILELFVTASTDKNPQVRQYAMQYVVCKVAHAVENGAAATITRTGAVDVLDRCLRKSLSDANPAVREASREVFDILMEHWPKRAEALLADVDPNTRKAVVKSSGAAASKKPKGSAAAKLDNTKTPIPSLAAAASREYSSPAKTSPKKALAPSSPSPAILVQPEQPVFIELTQTPAQQIVSDLGSQQESRVSNAITSISTLTNRLSQEEHSEIRHALSLILSEPSSPSVLELLLNTPTLDFIISTNLFPSSLITTTAMSILTGDTPYTFTAFQLSPTLQSMLTNHVTTAMEPTHAFHFLSQSLSHNSTMTPLLKPRSSRPPTVSKPTQRLGFLNASTFTTRLLSTFLTTSLNTTDIQQLLTQDLGLTRSILISITRLLSLKSTTKSCRKDLFTVLKVLGVWSCCRLVLEKYLETVDFEVADEIRGVLGITGQEEAEEGVVGREVEDVREVYDSQPLTVSTELETVAAPPAIDLSVSDLTIDEIFEQQVNLADITFENGLVEESFLVEQQSLYENRDRDDDDDMQVDYCQKGTNDHYEQAATPKAMKSILLRSDLSSPVAVSGRGMVGASLTLERSFSETPSNAFDEPIPIHNHQQAFSHEAATSPRPSKSITATARTNSRLEFNKWMMKFQNQEYTTNVLEMLYCMANPNGGVSARACDSECALEIYREVFDVLFGNKEDKRVLGKEVTEGLLLILNELLLREEVRRFIIVDGRGDVVVRGLVERRSDARFEVAGSADNALVTFMDIMDTRLCFDALVYSLEGRVFGEWKEDESADDYQPHPISSLFDCLGKVVRDRVGSDVGREDGGWGVNQVMSVCAKEMSSTCVDVRRSAMMCLVDISKVWEGDGFWGKVGLLLSPSQIHLLTSYVSS